MTNHANVIVVGVVAAIVSITHIIKYSYGVIVGGLALTPPFIQAINNYGTFG